MSVKKIHSLLVGGTRGVGLALAKLLSERGHAVSLIARRPPEGDILESPYISFHAADILDKESVSRALDEIMEKSGKLDHAVLLQRYRGHGDDWAGEMETTLSATRFLVDRLKGLFDGTDCNSIVLAGSMAARFVVENQPLSYHVGRAGIEQMIKWYAVAMGPLGIRVNGVSFGTIVKDRSAAYFKKNAGLRKFHESITPLRRMGTADDIAKVISFLLSPDASFITGQVIAVDGGLTLQWQESLAMKAVRPLEGTARARHAGEGTA